jgi:hypothetical protein
MRLDQWNGWCGMYHRGDVMLVPHFFESARIRPATQNVSELNMTFLKENFRAPQFHIVPSSLGSHSHRNKDRRA